MAASECSNLDGVNGLRGLTNRGPPVDQKNLEQVVGAKTIAATRIQLLLGAIGPDDDRCAASGSLDRPVLVSCT